jgi:uncharacterized protein DUF4177
MKNEELSQFFIRHSKFFIPPQFATLTPPNRKPTGGSADMKTWEYKIINVRSENYSMDPRRAEELNRLGDEGWELVSITSINFKTGATDHIGMVFKREKQPQPA